MNKCRHELREALERTKTIRPPALRRSLREDFLYATDLPRAADREETDGFLRRVRRMGWRAEETDGWIQLDYDAPGAAEGIRPFAPGPEAACCAGILRRHPEARVHAPEEIRALIKAGEEGAEAYERACGALHRRMAEALRRHERLPDIPLSCFEEA